MTNFEPASSEDLEIIKQQLGRPVRGVAGIAARCVCGNPLVVATVPRLPDGTPFPTTFYATEPALTAAASRLEATGYMATLQAQLTADEALSAHYQKAHEDYLAARTTIGNEAGIDDVSEIKDFSAGGMPERIKCLHAVVAHSLAQGPGVNPIGDITLEKMHSDWNPTQCSCAQPRSAPLVKRVAAIDCGTNSIRLLIADYDKQSGKLIEVTRENTTVRLGQGVDATGAFHPAAIDRTFAAIDNYAGLIQQHGAQQVRFVATSATRDASNRKIFIDGVIERLGIEPEVITGIEEASLSFNGALLGVAEHATAPYLVVDLGGGSTELVLGDGEGVKYSYSMDIGCVRLTERHAPANPPTAQDIAAMNETIDQAFTQLTAEVPIEQAHTLIGVAGSITTVTAHALGLTSYDRQAIHGASVPIEALETAAQELLHKTTEKRASLGFMHPGRVDVIGAGALIWARVAQLVAKKTEGRVKSALTSESDILDGIALSLALR